MSLARALLVATAATTLGACSPCDGAVVSAGPLEVCAEVAATEAARRQGLQGRAPLATDVGLLLDFPFSDEICIVNDGVDFAIDAIFADAQAQVTHVERGIPAGDMAARCVQRTQRVLEVAANVAAAVQTGDTMTVNE